MQDLHFVKHNLYTFVLLDVPLSTGKLDPLEEVHILQAFLVTCARSSFCETQSVYLCTSCNPLNIGKLDPLEEVHMLQAFVATCAGSSFCET